MESLVARLLDFDDRDFTDDLLLAAKQTMIDTLGAMVFGNQTAENQRYARYKTEIETGRFAVVGTPYRLSLQDAAFVNGCGSVATEMDEGNQWSKGHPAVHVIPVLLTLVQLLPACSGKRFLTALVTGYEACSRFGRATTLVPNAHAHGTWGAMGAAASALLLVAPGKEELVEGIRLGASFALPTMWSAALKGALIRNAYAGHAAEMGIRTVHLVKAGFRAPDDAVEYIFGQVLGEGFDASALTDQLGRPWDIQRNYFKPYAFCRYAHAPIDAFAELMAEHGLTAEEVEQVEVLTYSRASTLKHCDPNNVLSAKFSIPYALAVWLYTGKADQDSFTDALLSDGKIRDFARRVTVKVSEELEKDYPNIMPAEVRVMTTGGETKTKRCDIAKGGPTQPLRLDDLTEKFRSLTKSVFPGSRQDEILNWIMNLEEKKDMSEFIKLCTPQ